MNFSEKIIDWYLLNKRDLPWRKTSNPYHIWLSEIILQQTRVVQGMDYYYAFIEKYPTIVDLANASEEEVLKTWQGLGYYTRARNLHATANIIKNNYKGVFPNTYEEILKLKGIGKYTAAAVSSFAFKLPYPVVDGNVYRFISRLEGIYTPINTEKAFNEFFLLLEPLIDSTQPDLFNHGIMEFGAMVCKPSNPSCSSCIFTSECYALKHGKVQELPVKMKIKIPKQRYFYFLVLRIENEGKIYTFLRKRVGKDIWKNLYEFPYIESIESLNEEMLKNEIKKTLKTFGIEKYSINNMDFILKHQLTHQTINASFIEVTTKKRPKEIENYTICLSKDVYNYPVSILIDKYLKK